MPSDDASDKKPGSKEDCSYKEDVTTATACYSPDSSCGNEFPDSTQDTNSVSNLTAGLGKEFLDDKLGFKENHSQREGSTIVTACNSLTPSCDNESPSTATIMDESGDNHLE